MRLLVDTHCWLWLQTDPHRLSQAALDLLSSLRTEVFFSAASSWEIAIKHALGKLALPAAPREYIPKRLRANGFQPLPIRLEHTLEAGELPLHHRDPFDRLLVAQARLDRLAILTVDPAIRRYDVRVLSG